MHCLYYSVLHRKATILKENKSSISLKAKLKSNSVYNTKSNTQLHRKATKFIRKLHEILWGVIQESYKIKRNMFSVSLKAIWKSISVYNIYLDTQVSYKCITCLTHIRKCMTCAYPCQYSLNICENRAVL